MFEIGNSPATLEDYYCPKTFSKTGWRTIGGLRIPVELAVPEIEWLPLDIEEPAPMNVFFFVPLFAVLKIACELRTLLPRSSNNLFVSPPGIKRLNSLSISLKRSSSTPYPTSLYPKFKSLIEFFKL